MTETYTIDGRSQLDILSDKVNKLEKAVKDIMKAMEKKKIEWQKPELVELGKASALTHGQNNAMCHDCLSGHNAGGGLLCYKGTGVKK